MDDKLTETDTLYVARIAIRCVSLFLYYIRKQAEGSLNE